MNAISVLVNGAQGRMGQEAVQAITEESGLELVAQTDLGDDLPAVLRNSGVQVAVDFTTATVAYDNARMLIECGVRPVIGTSGLLPGQVAELQALCQAKQIGGVIAPNFAIGAVLMMKYAVDAVKYLPHVEVIELHHDRKADAPSGTAVKTANLLAEARAEIPAPLDEKELIPGARGGKTQGIPVHSIRLPGLVAHQEVYFGGVGETLKLRHDSISRESFMPGVLRAVRESADLDQIVVGLDRLLGLVR